MNTVVFLGPSLRLGTAQSLLNAEYRPPVRRGDLSACDSATTVVIIDGEFDQSFSVTPKEILALLDRGTMVLGASSMGALRAAELSRYGMVGVGTIYEWYMAGKIDGDDEVAMTFSPLDGRPLTVPFVNVRMWLSNLRREGEIDSRMTKTLLRRIRSIYFRDRTTYAIEEVCSRVCGSQWLTTLRERHLDEIPDLKASDARLVLTKIAN